MKSSKFACVGSINFDVITRLETWPDVHTKTSAEEVFAGLGGSAANTATWLAALPGNEVFLTGVVGSDVFGDKCLASIAAAGVDISHVETVPDWDTPLALSLVSDGNKRIITSPKKSIGHQIYEHLHTEEGVSHVHLSGGNMSMMSAVLANGSVPEVSLSMDIPMSVDLSLLKRINLGFINSDDLFQLAGVDVNSITCADRNDLFGSEEAVLVVTNSNKSIVVVSDKPVEYKIDALNVTEIVDRTGAGDAFNAGFLHVWAKNSRIEEAVTSGCHAAKMALKLLGGSKS